MPTSSTEAKEPYTSSTSTNVDDGDLVTLLNCNDVLCGRGGRVNSHSGNVKFRMLVREHRDTYLSKKTKKLDKVKIADKIVNIIRNRNPPGRFLKESNDDTEDGWYDIGDFKAGKKAGQAMRESGNNNAIIRPPTPPPSSTEASNLPNSEDEKEKEKYEQPLRKRKLRLQPQPQRMCNNFSLIQALQNEQSIYCPPVQQSMSAPLPLSVPSSTNAIDSMNGSREASLLGMLLNNVNTNANNQQTVAVYQPLYSMPQQQPLPPMVPIQPFGINRRRLYLEMLKDEPSRLPPPPPPQTILDCEVIAMMHRHNRRRLL